MAKDKSVKIFIIQTKEKAHEFVKYINSLRDVHIEFEDVGYAQEQDTRVLRRELKRDVKQYGDYITDWARSFTREHKPNFEFKFGLEYRPNEPDLTVEKIYPSF